jgi:hypothetical protein
MTVIDIERQRRLEQWLQGVLLATVFADPEHPGLTRDELLELARPEGFGTAELLEHRVLAGCKTYSGRFLPSGTMTLDLTYFHDAQEGDPRNIAAYQWVLEQFSELTKEYGIQRARLPLAVLLERTPNTEFSKADVHAAVVSYILEGDMVEEEGTLRLQKPITTPRQQLASQGGQQQRGRRRAPHLVAPVLAQVRDLVGRRTDGRAMSSDPIRAFGDKFAELVGSNQRLWWEQQVNELKTLNPHTHPTMMLVAAASLVEGALTALVGRARELTGGGAFGSREFDRPPKDWKLEGLLKAARQAETGIFTSQTEPLYRDALRLNENRQRIHFARFLMTDNPISIDIRPHDAENAVTTTKRVLTVLMEWLAAAEHQRSTG